MAATELTRIQKAAVAEAMAKSLKKLTSTNGGGLRSEADRELLEAYRENGVDRQRVSINGVEVATLSIAFSKEYEEHVLSLDDIDAFETWLLTKDEGHDTLHSVILNQGATPLLDTARAYGFLPDGCHVDVIQHEKQPKGTRFLVKPEKVAEALKDGLPGVVSGLIAGETE